MKIIKELDYEFYDPKLFVDEFQVPKKEKKFYLLLMMGLNLFMTKRGLT